MIIDVTQFAEGEERVEWFGRRHAHSYVFRNGGWTRGRCLVIGEGVCDMVFNSTEFAKAAAGASAAEEWLREAREGECGEPRT